LSKNARVRKGQFIAEIRDLDEGYGERLESKVAAARAQVDAAERQVETHQQNLKATRNLAAAYQTQVKAYERVYDEITLSRDKRVASAKTKREADLQRLKSVEALFNLETEALERAKARREAGQDISVETLIDAQRKLIEAETKLSEAKAAIESAENDVAEKQNMGDAYQLKAQADVEYYKGLVAKSEVETTRANGEMAKAQADLANAEKEMRDLETRLARQESQQIIAPFDGVVTQLTPAQLVKKGDSICTLLPD
jgi:putative ABC transport system permease protein